MKNSSALIFLCLLISTISFGQNLLNKLKSKASQEVNKLEHIPNSSSPSPNKNKLSSNVTRSVAVSLQNDENFDYSENCIDLGSSVDQASFIVTKNRGNQAQCFSYKNGTRTPVPCPTSNSNCNISLQCSYNKLRSIDLDGDEAKPFITNETESHEMAQPAMSDQQMKMMEAYMTKEQLAEMKKQLAQAQQQTAGKTYSTVKSRTIKFNGKSYGPYSQLAQFYLTNDNQNFYAVISDIDQKTMAQTLKMITSTSATPFVIPGITPPMQCLASGDNSEFAVVSLTLEGKHQVTTSKGKTMNLDPSDINNIWYAPNNRLTFLSKNQLTQDGKVIKTFEPNSYYESCDLYVSSDGNGVTVVKNNTISFADGDYFEYPLKIAVVSSGGKNYFKWLALENREVVIYQKPY